MVQRIKTVQESDLRMLGSLARSIQRVLPVTQADIDAAAALGQGWVVTRVFEVSDPLDNLRGGTQLVIRQNSILPGQNVQRVLIVSGPGGQTVIVRGSEYIALPDAIADSLEYLKAFGGTEQRNLPDGYIQRQFIYMMDGSYLLTDIVPTYDCKVEMDFQTTTQPSIGGAFLGGRTGGAYSGLVFGYNTNKTFTFDAFSTYRYTSNVVLSDNTRYKYVFDNKVATLYQGSTIFATSTFTGTDATGGALAINALNNNGTISANNAGIYLYSFKMWDNQGNLIADYVPAIQKGTVPVVGFYDTVSGTFKTATAGTFAAGGEAVPTPDAPMDIVSNNGVLKASPNLYNLATRVNGYYIDASGNPVAYVQNCYSALIPVKPNTTYVFSGINGLNGTNNKRLHAYDSNGNWLAQLNFVNVGTPGNPFSVTGTTTAQTAYVRISFAIPDTNVQVEQGSVATPYMPYGEIYVDSASKNLFNIATATPSMGIDAFTGEMSSLANVVSASDYIPVSGGKNYTLNIQSWSTNPSGLAWYNANKEYISGQVYTGSAAQTFTAPANAYYARITVRTDQNPYQFEEGTTATPYAPYWNTVETINIHGKNLFGGTYETLENTYIDASGNYNSNSSINTYRYFKVSPSTVYTISGKTTMNGALRIAEYTSNKTFVVRNAYAPDPGSDLNPKITITTTATTEYLAMSIDKDVYDIQFEQGTTATDYQPYFDGGTATAEMLLKVGDYEDVQSIIDGAVTRNVGIKVLDGTEDWTYGNPFGEMFCAGDFFPAFPNIPTRLVLSTHFIGDDVTPSLGSRNGHIARGQTGTSVGIGYNALNGGITAFKQWLSDQYAAGTPVIVVYPLATPTTESVAGQTMQVRQGDNIVEITQASLDGLELEAKYQAAVSLTIQEVQDANLDPNVQVTIN